MLVARNTCNQVADVLEGSRLLAITIYCQGLSCQGLGQEIADHPSIVQSHSRSIRVKDSHDAHLHISLLKKGKEVLWLLGMALNSLSREILGHLNFICRAKEYVRLVFDPDLHVMLSLVIESETLGSPLALIIAASFSYAIDISPVLLLLWMLQRVSVYLRITSSLIWLGYMP